MVSRLVSDHLASRDIYILGGCLREVCIQLLSSAPSVGIAGLKKRFPSLS